MQESAKSTVRRRRLRRYLRTLGVIVSSLVLLWSFVLAAAIDVTSNGKQEWLNGQANSNGLLLPLLLFLVGVVGLATSLR